MTLLTKQWLFSRLIARLILDLTRRGYEVTLAEAYRTPEQAKLNAKSGAGIANSLHTQRLAIDLNLFLDGKFLTETEDYLIAGELWESYSTMEYECAWGGRFKTRPDGNHFSIAHGDIR